MATAVQTKPKLTTEQKIELREKRRAAASKNAHYSHTKFGGIKLTLGGNGIVFTKKPNTFNRCIGEELRNTIVEDRAAARSQFAEAVTKCKK